MILYILLSTLAHTIQADWYHNTKAFEITSANIESILGQEKHVILDFFTPWCIYCQYMANDWNQVWEHYNGDNGKRTEDVLIAKINCGDEQNHPICHDFHVHSFPTILHFEIGQKTKSHHFNGNRAFRDFVLWIDRVCPEKALTPEQVEKKEEVVRQERQLVEERAALVRRQIEEQNTQRELEEQLRKQLEEQILQQQQKDLLSEQQGKDKKLELGELSQAQIFEKDIQAQIKQIEIQFESYKTLDSKIEKLESQITKLESKMNNQKQIWGRGNVNWSHALVFIICGAFLGIIMVILINKSNRTQNKLDDSHTLPKSV